MNNGKTVYKTGVVHTNTRLNLRDKPNKDLSKVLMTLKDKEELLVISEIDGWYRVETNDGTIGYCMQEFVSME